MYPQLLEFLGDAAHAETILCAHNAQFDMGFLSETLIRLGIIANFRYVDTLRLSRKYLKGMPNYKQTTLADCLGISVKDAHRAADDAQVCGEILQYVMGEIKDEIEEKKMQFEKACPTEEELAVCAFIQNIITRAGEETLFIRYRRNSSNYVEASCLYPFLKFKFSRKGKYIILPKQFAHHGFEVEDCTVSEGGTSNIQPGMESGEFDLYPEYTSSGWVLVLKHEKGSMSDEEMFEALKKEYEEQFNMTWVGLYGFNNTYTLVCRKAVVDQYNIKTTSDMAAVSENLVFGANADYIERADGYPALKETYGFNFKYIKDIDIGLKYQAMDSGDIDVTNGYTTDAQLSRDEYVALEDDKHLQVNYFCSTIVRKEALEEYEGLEDVLKLMDGLISDNEMATMNYEVEVEGKDEAEVAKAFLASKGLLEE